MERALERVRAGEEDPPCRTCGGILKSATISFGQNLVVEDLERAQRAAEGCDLLLAVGSTLTVYPAAGVVPIAKQAGAALIIVNADRVVLTGRKRTDKLYHWHTGHIGGIKERTARQILEGKFPGRVIEKAIERMMPDGPLARRQLRNLHVYSGPEHPHAAQQPQPLDVGALNRKNKRAA